MAIKGIRSLTCKPEEAKKFYIEALGFELDYEQPGWTGNVLKNIKQKY